MLQVALYSLLPPPLRRQIDRAIARHFLSQIADKHQEDETIRKDRLTLIHARRLGERMFDAFLFLSMSRIAGIAVLCDHHRLTTISIDQGYARLSLF